MPGPAQQRDIVSNADLRQEGQILPKNPLEPTSKEDVPIASLQTFTSEKRKEFSHSFRVRGLRGVDGICTEN